MSLADLAGAVFQRIREAGDAPIFISLVEEGAMAARIRELEASAQMRGMHAYPLFGVPFAVKDNIDVAGIPTTAACRDFAYTPAKSSPVVEALEAAGALFIGKTNLDQFATGLTGLLSSYGPLRNIFNSEYICGGSSSGSRRGGGIRDWCRLRWVPILAESRVGCRRRLTTSSGSSRRAACFPPAASYRRADRWIACPFSR